MNFFGLSSGAGETGWKPIEKFDYRWGDSKKSFVFERPVKSEDPGDYQRFIIRQQGAADFVLPDLNGIKLGPKLVRADSQKRSRYSAFLPLEGAKKTPYVILQQWPFASSPGETIVLALVGEKPQLVFRGEYEIARIADLDKDGTLEIAGAPSFSECVETNLCTYDPSTVMKLDLTGESPKLVVDLLLSEKENRAHGYPWIGLEKAGKAWVYKRSRVITEEEMQKMLKPTK